MASVKTKDRLSELDKKLLGTLATLGGQHVTQDDLRIEGKEFILPEGMTPTRGIKFLKDYIAAEETEHQFERTFNYRPWDGGHALGLALRDLTGTAGIGKAIVSFFGVQPPRLHTINVGVGKTEQILWGQIEVPLFKGTLFTSSIDDEEKGPLFQLVVNAPKKYGAAIEGLFRLVEEKLRTDSIYKGKAINGATNAEFLDLSGVDPEKVVYNADVRAQLDANVWSIIKYPDQMDKLGIPKKRATLLQGPYGSGKTLAGYLTAQIAVENGWTCLYCRPERDNLFEVMQTARLYQPAVVFFEDVDVVADPVPGSTGGGVAELLDIFDGITAKGTSLVAVLTTNHADKIHKGMIRPGRLDAVIEIGALDEGGVEEMASKFVPDNLLAEGIDWEPVAQAMEGFLPAFIREALDRSMRYSIARNEGVVGKITQDDLVHAALGLRPQLDLMEAASDSKEAPVIDTAIARVVHREIEANVGGARLRDLAEDYDSHEVVLQNGQNS